jgi:hypothetical protein
LSTDKIKTVNNYHLLQASNKPQEEKQHGIKIPELFQGELLRLNIIRIENTKDFWENIP